MSKVIGRLVTCDRCGKSEFAKYTGTKEFDGGFTRINHFESLTDWGIYENKDLCPKCFEEWCKLRDEFMTKEKSFFER